MDVPLHGANALWNVHLLVCIFSLATDVSAVCISTQETRLRLCALPGRFLRLNEAQEIACLLAVDVVHDLFTLHALFALSEAIHLSHTLLKLLSKGAHHGLFDLILDLGVLEELHSRKDFSKRLQTSPQHDDNLSNIQLGCLPQVKEDQH